VAVSLSQLSELGAAYRPEDIAAIADHARAHELGVHMDGARFASAVAGLGVAPADVTWRAGVDVLSFGGTKNGCLTAEAVMFFDPDRAASFAAARQRAGHAFSKSWLIAAQFLAYLEGGHWLDLARAANERARAMATAIESSDSARLACRPDGNEIFAILAKPVHDRLKSDGAIYYEWSDDGIDAPSLPGDDEVLVRLDTSFATTRQEVERFADIVAG
jgi:threonine aldolase